MKLSLIACIGCLLVLLTANQVCAGAGTGLGTSTLQVGYIGIWANEARSDCGVSAAQYSIFDAWIWCQPSCNGLQAAEFAVGVPGTVIISTTTPNPDIAVSLGSLTGGIAFAYGECQTDWTYTHHLTCLNLAPGSVPDSIVVVPSPEAQIPSLLFSNCTTGYPIEPANLYTPLHINRACDPTPPTPPELIEVTCQSPTNIRAVFNTCVASSAAWSPQFYVTDALFNEIEVIDVSQYTENELSLTLQTPMIDSTAYTLCMRGYVMSCEGAYNRSAIGFTFVETMATLLQSWSASFVGAGVELAWALSEVDPGVEFFVYRSENGADFLALDMAALARDNLGFTYLDSNVQPGTKYVYRVEYAVDGGRRTLFLSEEVRTPAAFLALEQNRPNPFNPTTAIAYTLPEACAVRVVVYDVSGRLVARLVDGARQTAGRHAVEWNGRDAAGRVASSGIYVYRLVAGKETLSRKMVLVR